MNFGILFVRTLNEGTNFLVTNVSEPDGWFVMHRGKMNSKCLVFILIGGADFLHRW